MGKTTEQDFEVVLADAIRVNRELLDRAREIKDRYDQRQPQFEAAYQIFKDLERAVDELVLTYNGIRFGAIG